MAQAIEAGSIAIDVAHSTSAAVLIRALRFPRGGPNPHAHIVAVVHRHRAGPSPWRIIPVRQPTSPAPRSHSRAAKSLVAIAAITAAVGVATPAFAKNGLEGGAAPTTPSACAPITVTNSGRIVKNRTSPPDIKFTVNNCTGQPTAATVTISEGAGLLAALCPSPVAAPVQLTLAGGQKVAGSAPAYRASCGWYSQTSTILMQGTSAWQGHNMLVTLTDDATGAVLGTSTYTWKDDKPGV